jgi:hypothetical protein
MQIELYCSLFSTQRVTPFNVIFTTVFQELNVRLRTLSLAIENLKKIVNCISRTSGL